MWPIPNKRRKTGGLNGVLKTVLNSACQLDINKTTRIPRRREMSRIDVRSVQGRTELGLFIFHVLFLLRSGIYGELYFLSLYAEFA